MSPWHPSWIAGALNLTEYVVVWANLLWLDVVEVLELEIVVMLRMVFFVTMTMVIVVHVQEQFFFDSIEAN